MNQTIESFGYPHLLIKEFKNWVVLLRQKQVTIGSLVIVAKPEVYHLGALHSDVWSEFAAVSKFCEGLLTEKFGAEKFNYLALMMKDPHVYFHMMPRYSKPVSLGGKTYIDVDWPLKTEMKSLSLTEDEYSLIKKELQAL